jgi:alpha-aminoadipic semialdehyde synthase
MKNTIGIRRESVDITERRAPLTPKQVAKLTVEYDLEVIVQPSSLRYFPDEEYASVGAKISDDVSRCNVLFGVKEIPIERIERGQVHCFFSHTIKAQRYNMPLLSHIVESDCTLLDYELVTNETGRRLIYFGEFAGYAGMVDALWALGKRLDWEGAASPFGVVGQTKNYDTLAQAKEAIGHVGRQIQAEGLPDEITPFVCAFTGRGHVSKGAQEILKLLPTVEIRPEDLPTLASSGTYSKNAVYWVEFRKPDLYEPFEPDAGFDPDEFDQRPGKYREKFHRYVEHLDMVVNGIFWSPRSPRILTREHLCQLYARDQKPKLRLIADVTCDIEGSIELTVRSSTSDDPVYVYEPVTGHVNPGFAGDGPVIMAVDNLPSELPGEASDSFGKALLPFIPGLARADFTQSIDDLDIPAPFKKAVIAHRGVLTANFRYLNAYLI